MPANDADIIAAVTMAGYYSKFYTTNSTPKTVLLSQIPSIDPKYSFFYDAKNKTKLTLFKTQGDEARADKMYEYTFKAYTGGYFPITQTSDSISFIIRGTGTHVFDWGDGTTTSYTLTTGADTTISKTWTTNLGGQKNISVTGNVKNWTKLDTFSFNYNECFRISGMNLNYLRVHSNPDIKIVGSITGMMLTTLNLTSCNFIFVSGSITGMPLIFISLALCNNVNVNGLITNMLLSVLTINNCPLVSILGFIEQALISSAANLFINKVGVTYGGGATKAWNISQTVQAEWTSAMVDAWFNAYSLTAPIVTAKTLNFAGTNQAPTSASLAARNNIISKGFIIIINS